MNWRPPQSWLQITAIDAHTAGEPLRIFTGGYPRLQGDTMLAKRRYALEKLDHLRTATMWEPRGHADMYGCIITEAVTDDGDFGVIFTHNEGYSSMCGHGIIAVTKVGLETGIIHCQRENNELRIDTPAGRVTSFARWEGNCVSEVSFFNVPSFVYTLDQVATVPGLGEVKYDIAFGGAFYAFVQAEEVGVELAPAGFRRLIELGTTIKEAVMNRTVITHPYEEDLSFLYGVIFIGNARKARHHSRNVCVFADGEVDRSPTGTGVSARAALHFARRELAQGEPFTVESILGTCFTGEVTEVKNYGPYEAVIPKITGAAHICGSNTLLIDPEDPLRNGFMLR